MANLKPHLHRYPLAVFNHHFQKMIFTVFTINEIHDISGVHFHYSTELVFFLDEQHCFTNCPKFSLQKSSFSNKIHKASHPLSLVISSQPSKTIQSRVPQAAAIRINLNRRCRWKFPMNQHDLCRGRNRRVLLESMNNVSSKIHSIPKVFSMS